MERQYFIAIDGGGTKTEFALFSNGIRVEKTLVLAGSNPNSCGMDEACRILRDGISSLLEDAPRPAGIFAGVAGAFSGDNGRIMEERLKAAFPSLRIKVESDIMNIISGVGDSSPCVAGILGTGSVVCAYDGASLRRFGGYGYIFDGAGSGFDIGRDALSLCLAKDDGMAEESVLTRLVESKLGGKAWPNLGALYRGGRDEIASFAKIVFDAHRAGSPDASCILRRNLERVVALISCALRAVPSARRIILAGGLMRDRDLIEPILKELSPSLPAVSILEKSPIFGACVRCAELFA